MFLSVWKLIYLQLEICLSELPSVQRVLSLRIGNVVTVAVRQMIMGG